MRNSDEPIPKKESFDDNLFDLARLSGDEILELAKGKYGKRDGGDGSPFSLSYVIAFLITGILFLIFLVMFIVGPMLVDPLFLYVPTINENIKCLALDQKLKKAVIVLRSFTDVPFLLIILFRVLLTSPFRRFVQDALADLDVPEEARGVLPKSLIHNILAVLPIPQIVILIFLPTMKNSRSLNIMKLLNSFILLQYVVRAYPMYKICKRINKDTRERSKELAKRKKIWIRGVINFIMYILASHVLGALWYFFSVQREIDCWISTCRTENGCNLSTLQCDKSTFRNVTLLNDLCPTNPPNQTVYDFGIFVGTLQSGIVGTTDFPQKLLMCLSWGLRNLSSFASNLNSSAYAWESIFVIFISISGLLLFMYLLGHVQTFMQAISRKSDIRKQMRAIRPQILFMLLEYGLPARIHYAIEKLVREALEEDDDLVVENIFSVLPRELQKHIKRHLFLARLKELRGLENKDRQVLDAIMEDLDPVSYADGSYIIREGEPLDRMIFITQGTALVYKTSTTGGESGSSITTHLAKGDVYGKELCDWAATSTTFSGLPISDKTVKSHENVEVFAIWAAKLQRIISISSTHYDTELPHLADSSTGETHVEIVQTGKFEVPLC